MKVPKYLKCIPEGSHGSGSLQKRLWTLVSAYVRIRDWYKYKTCVATGKYISSWQEGNAGHFKAYAKCNGIYKFDPRNIHLQSARSNSWGDFDDWKSYEAELVRRYGQKYVDDIETDNRDTSLKFTEQDVLEQIESIIKEIAKLPEQPHYFPRLMERMENENV